MREGLIWQKESNPLENKSISHEKEIIPLLRDQFRSLVDCLVLLGFLGLCFSLEADWVHLEFIMKSIKVKGRTIELFDSISELTAERDHAINKLVVMDLQIGSTMENVYQHLSQLSSYASQNRQDEVIQEVKNLHNNFFMMINNVNMKSLTFAVFVNKIDGKYRKATTSEEAQKVLDELLKIGIKSSEVQEQVSSLKKKLMTNFEPSFLIGSGLNLGQTF